MSFLRNPEFWGVAVGMGVLLATPIVCQVIINNQKEEAAKPNPNCNVENYFCADKSIPSGDAAYLIKRDQAIIESGMSRN